MCCVVSGYQILGEYLEPMMKELIINFWKDEEGATAIEYGLIAALIAVAAIVAMGLVGDGLTGIFTTISEKLGVAPAPGG